jgi:hypothetical protein
MSIWMLACPLGMMCLPGSAWLAARLGRTPGGRAVRARCMSALGRPHVRDASALEGAVTDGATITDA